MYKLLGTLKIWKINMFTYMSKPGLKLVNLNALQKYDVPVPLPHLDIQPNSMKFVQTLRDYLDWPP